MSLKNDTMNEIIDKIWFDRGRIYITTTNGEERFLPLELFPEYWK